MNDDETDSLRSDFGEPLEGEEEIVDDSIVYSITPKGVVYTAVEFDMAFADAILAALARHALLRCRANGTPAIVLSSENVWSFTTIEAVPTAATEVADAEGVQL